MPSPAKVASQRASVVLVVDADFESARGLAEHLTQRGFRAFHTSSAEDAVRLALAGKLALAIVDVTLADMAGHALASQLKRTEPDLPILMTTGDYRPELEIRARQLGIVYYAHKPLDYRLIEAVVTKALNGVRDRVRSGPAGLQASEAGLA